MTTFSEAIKPIFAKLQAICERQMELCEVTAENEQMRDNLDISASSWSDLYQSHLKSAQSAFCALVSNGKFGVIELLLVHEFYLEYYKEAFMKCTIKFDDFAHVLDLTERDLSYLAWQRIKFDGLEASYGNLD